MEDDWLSFPTREEIAIINIEEFDDMEDELNEVAKLNQQVQQMQQQHEDDENAMKQYKSQIVRSEIQEAIAVEKLNAMVGISVAATKAEGDIENEKLQIQLKEARKPKTEGE